MLRVSEANNRTTLALSLGSGLSAAATGAYVALVMLPLRIAFIILDPDRLSDGGWADLAIYGLSWLTIAGGCLIVQRTLRYLRHHEQPAERWFRLVGAMGLLLSVSWSIVLYAWYIQPLLTGTSPLGLMEALASIVIGAWIASSALSLRPRWRRHAIGLPFTAGLHSR